jgi:hypothetical protein
MAHAHPPAAAAGAAVTTERIFWVELICSVRIGSTFRDAPPCKRLRSRSQEPRPRPAANVGRSLYMIRQRSAAAVRLWRECPGSGSLLQGRRYVSGAINRSFVIAASVVDGQPRWLSVSVESLQGGSRRRDVKAVPQVPQVPEEQLARRQQAGSTCCSRRSGSSNAGGGSA